MLQQGSGLALASPSTPPLHGRCPRRHRQETVAKPPPGAGAQDWDLAQHRHLTWATLVPPPHPLRALHLLNAGWDQREALGPQHGEQTQPSCQEEQLPCQGPCVRSGGTWPPGHPFTPGLVGLAPSPSQRPLGSVGWVGRHRFLWIP